MMLVKIADSGFGNLLYLCSSIMFVEVILLSWFHWSMLDGFCWLYYEILVSYLVLSFY